MEQRNITKLTESFIEAHPSILDCLKSNLINYSKLSRRVSNEKNLKPKDFDAVLIAARRYRQKMKGQETKEAAIKRLLRESRMEIKTKINVFVLEKSIYFDDLLALQSKIKKTKQEVHIIQGTDSITVITSQDFMKDFIKMFKNDILARYLDCAEIIIKTSPEIEALPGVTAYLTSLFAHNGINIIETMGCYTDNLFIISEKDIGQAIAALKF